MFDSVNIIVDLEMMTDTDRLISIFYSTAVKQPYVVLTKLQTDQLNQYDSTVAHKSLTTDEATTSEQNSHVDDRNNVANTGGIKSEDADMTLHTCTEESVTALHRRECKFDTNDSEAYDRHVTTAHTNMLSTEYLNQQ